MKKLLVLATAAAVLLIAPAAQASTPCDGATSVATRGGYNVEFDRYRALAPHEASEVTWRMNCASIRYAARAVQAEGSDTARLSAPAEGVLRRLRIVGLLHRRSFRRVRRVRLKHWLSVPWAGVLGARRR